MTFRTFSATRRAALALCVAACLAPGAVLAQDGAQDAAQEAAQDLAAPKGRVLLTVSGDIAVGNGDGVARFDRAMLEALPSVTIETTTVWTEGLQIFTGVSLKTLMERLGADGDNLRATAVNDYAVDIPSEDWIEGGAVLAYRNHGEPMKLREKGPLWVIYPFDSTPEYQSEVAYSRSIWQLDRMKVE